MSYIYIYTTAEQFKIRFLFINCRVSLPLSKNYNLIEYVLIYTIYCHLRRTHRPMLEQHRNYFAFP